MVKLNVTGVEVEIDAEVPPLLVKLKGRVPLVPLNVAKLYVAADAAPPIKKRQQITPIQPKHFPIFFSAGNLNKLPMPLPAENCVLQRLHFLIQPAKNDPMSTQAPTAAEVKLPRDVRVGVVAARFNEKLVNELLTGCVRRLTQLGIDEDHVEVWRVPGAFELPVAAQALARSGRVWAVICLGAVIRGDTPHFDYVAGEAARGIQRVSLSEHLPVIFGVLTTNNEEQAWERAGGKHGHAGERSAEAAVEMIGVMSGILTSNAPTITEMPS